jgi:hypothetical protein
MPSGNPDWKPTRFPSLQIKVPFVKKKAISFFRRQKETLFQTS